MNRLRPIALAVLASTLIACGEEAPPPRTAAAPTVPAEAAEASAWLGAHDPTPPARWLIDHLPDPARVAGPTPEDVTVQLLAAADRYRETPRMIANRAVQLQTMLAEEGIGEDASSLLTLLARLPPDNRVSFSADCQHYYNLRVQGLDREQALARLAAS
ncbi:MAG TPA: hypothetical protein VMR06_01790 [Dokdonella sp.]|uniref:hypothetical protein n=1 Tax=Dokdonella sp. TaxID=2291710 RepID=UPI002C248840|nr:hypothetical protein [Dokdonella sp.]HUD40707.1 hypothetical protein [Dokdonella sp.]